MSDNSEYTIEGGYTLSECIESLRIALRTLDDNRSMQYQHLHRLRALMTSLGTLARDASLLDWLDKQCEVLEDRNAFGETIEYRWCFSQMATNDHRHPSIRTRQHVRQILTDIKESNYQHARKLEYLEPKIDK